MRIRYNRTSVDTDELRRVGNRKQEILACTSRAIAGDTEAVIRLSSIALSLNELAEAISRSAADFAEKTAKEKGLDGKAEVSLEELTGEKD